ncbi:MAG TPA: Asp-tRNA(Asn)/Glu-tRNA(Gln) amidotransferase subunit GatB [Candidatus Saccharimonadales bacterium]|jgi:aspartyl-tRNA(Asn)/glutamyl-tRNA(Gln) amidotransferase subunit B|nr:Asp-tRNA(Asn)/Glu-tRNA(Gln) amidotransferase subunit GatB [Candidatus Saccharimonadales bacterium]
MVADEVLDKYEMTIGVECHVQLATATKLFSGADNDARDKSPNSVVSPIDFGLPGMLPVLNREAVNLAIKAGKALNAPIAKVSRFDRKHYFYPDLPKGYQTTQMYNPIILEGYIDAPLEDGSTVRVRIHHAHMEEDAGKLTHYSDYSLVDLNRAGTPLIEIVSEPDIHSAAEAKAYASELHHLMTYAGVTRGDLYHGNMRFDVNVSVALKGATQLGTRAEVKNLNSFRSVEKAAEYEFRRQVAVLEKGERVVQETRGWDDAKQTTSSQRSKEDAQDYRYMPDADIPPIVLTDEEIAEIQATVPMLPPEYREKWQGLQLDSSVVNTILNNAPVAVTLDAINDRYDAEVTKRAFNWFSSTSADEIDIAAVESGLVGPRRLVELSQMVGDNKLSSTGAKEIFLALFDETNRGVMPEDIAREKNLLQVSDEGAIAAIVDEVLADPASAKAVEDIRNGNDKVIGFLVGQVMKKSQGKANPALAQKLIRERL